MHRKIVSSRLTTCGVVKDGGAVHIDLVSIAGHSVSIEMPIEQAESVIMTLPRLLSNAVRARTGDPQARFVFSIDQWMLESTHDAQCLLVTLKTADGFEVTFGIPFSHCQALGDALNGHASEQQDLMDDVAGDSAPRQLN